MRKIMVASISHDLRTPLNGMINFIKAALNYDKINDFTKNEYLLPALDCSEYLLHLVNDILTYTQIT
jgi:signal transduction histidine kinase